MENNGIEKLNVLDFSPGIRAEYINQNFELLRKWIEAERRRIGGWGIVEGFDLSKNIEDFSVSVTKGILINEDGQEVNVDAEKFIAGPPVYKTMVEEIVVQEEGVMECQFALYSNKQKHTIIYNPPEYDEIYDDEISLINVDTGARLTLNDIRFIDENVIILNAAYAGNKVKIEYLYANDRIDAIMLKKDGSEYQYELGVISTSPSQEVIEDYLANGYYLIGFAYWHIGKEIDVEFITVDRTFRPVFVDKDNTLYLNGKIYTGDKTIYFEEPEYPKENDLWYDVENEILYIWRPDGNGDYRWIPVNDLSRFNRDYGVFLESENPEDLQTFLFDDKANLRFVPGKNQLTITVDQITLMRDQYEELYTEAKYEDTVVNGYGFRLKCPLERPSRVEVTVDHSIMARGQELDLFPHTTAFIDEDVFEIDEEMEAGSVWRCNGQYQIGDNQLEVWRNGMRLSKNIDFVEALQNDESAGLDDYETLTDRFKVLIALEAGDSLSYRIIRSVSTYDNLKAVTDVLNKNVEDAVNKLEETTDTMEEVIETTGAAVDSMRQSVSQLESDMSDLKKNAVLKENGVGADELKEDIKGKLLAGANYLVQSANVSQIVIKGVDPDDFFSIYWIQDNNRLILIKDTDYTVSLLDDESGVTIDLDSQWVADDANVYIEIIKIGI